MKFLTNTSGLRFRVTNFRLYHARILRGKRVDSPSRFPNGDFHRLSSTPSNGSVSVFKETVRGSVPRVATGRVYFGSRLIHHLQGRVGQFHQGVFWCIFLFCVRVCVICRRVCLLLLSRTRDGERTGVVGFLQKYWFSLFPVSLRKVGMMSGWEDVVVGGSTVYVALTALTLTNYGGSRGGTRTELSGTEDVCRRGRFFTTGGRVSDVHVLCPGRFGIVQRNLALVHRIRRGRTRHGLTFYSDLVPIGRRRLRKLGGNFGFRGSSTCGRVNGCISGRRAVRHGVRHYCVHSNMGRGKRVCLTDICFKNGPVGRANVGLDVRSNLFTRAPTVPCSNNLGCRFGSLKGAARIIACRKRGYRSTIGFVFTGGRGHVGIRCAKNGPCVLCVTSTSGGTVTSACRLTIMLDSVRGLAGRGRGTAGGLTCLRGGLSNGGWGRLRGLLGEGTTPFTKNHLSFFVESSSLFCGRFMDNIAFSYCRCGTKYY